MLKLNLDASTTSLVLIDLQNGIVGMPMLAPRSGAEVVASAIKLTERFRAANALIILVNVGFAADFRDALKQPGRSIYSPSRRRLRGRFQ
jgi:nicotinamidase-related amidase